MSAGCPSPQALLDYAAGRLTAEARDALASHLDGCHDCLELAGEAMAEHRVAPTRDGSPGAAKRRERAQAMERPPERIERYVVVERLGQGGMGEVLLAYDPVLDRRVAVKLARRADESVGLNLRLQREAQALARVVDPNVVAVYDAGQFKGRPFVAMEYVPGTTLRGWLKTPRTRPEILRLFLEAGRGLWAAHKAGVVHRDFKPDNVLIDAGGHARVTDFGLATMLEVAEPTTTLDLSDDETQEVLRTGAGSVLGTPGYMPPEQWDGQPTDARSDQFSFCVALHEALIGERPFARPSVRGTRPDFALTPSASRREKEPAPLRRALARGLALRPDERYPSMEPLLTELERALRPLPVARLGVAAALVLAAGGAAFVAERSPCTGALALAQAPRAALQLHLPPALDSRVEQVATAFERDWAASWTTACVETHERKVQPLEVLGLRSECLELQQRRFGLVLRQLALPSAPSGASALEALELGPRPEACLGVEGLLSAERPSERQRMAVTQARERLVEAQVLAEVGRFPEAATVLSALEAQVKVLAFAPLETEVTWARGYVALREQRWHDARPLLRAALLEAAAQRDLRLAARAGAELVFVSGHQLGFPDEATMASGLARGLVKRLGDADLEGKLESADGLFAMTQGRLAEGRAHLERARVLRSAVFGPEHLETAKVVGNLALLAAQEGKLDEAEALGREDLRLRLAALGEDNLLVAVTLTNLAEVLAQKGDRLQSLALLERALRIQTAVLGASHSLTLSAQASLAVELALADRLDDARVTLKAARGQTEMTYGADSLEMAHIFIAEASIEQTAHRYLEALPASRAVLEIYRQRLAPREAVVLSEREREALLLERAGKLKEAVIARAALVDDWREVPGAAESLASALGTLGRAQLELVHEPARARVTLEEALQRSRPLSWPPARVGELEFLLAKTHLALGDRATALDFARRARPRLADDADWVGECAEMDGWLRKRP